MAKRLGNVKTVKDLREQGIPAAAVRHLIFSAHYRKELNLSDEALEGSIEAVRRVGLFAERLAGATGGTAELGHASDQALAEVRAALFDDLNAPEAVAALFTFVRRGNAELDRGGTDVGAVQRARDTFSAIDRVLDLVPGTEEEDPELAGWVEGRLAARREARARRDFAASDRIRDELAGRGVVVQDGANGTTWRRAR